MIQYSASFATHGDGSLGRGEQNEELRLIESYRELRRCWTQGRIYRGVSLISENVLDAKFVSGFGKAAALVLPIADGHGLTIIAVRNRLVYVGESLT